jgi:ATP-dependent DNA helicase PIF1
MDLNARNKILNNFMAPETLTLKKGSQVMLIKNMDSQLVNGSLGKVQAFMDEGTFHTYKDDEETYMRAQEPGDGSNDDDIAEARRKIEKARFKESDGKRGPYWPMVRFALPDGTYRAILCLPEEWKTESQQGEVTAKRLQVPLILAWALSIHKAQGQTLNRVKVDLGRVFERGQAYVALSRATSQAGLQVLRFDQRKVMVHPKVKEFYNRLEKAGSLTASKVAKKISQPALDDYDDDDEEQLYMYG